MAKIQFPGPMSADNMIKDPRVGAYQKMQDILNTQTQAQMQANAIASLRGGFVNQAAAHAQPINPLSTPPDGDSIELFRIDAKGGDECDVVPVYLPLGDTNRAFSFDTIQITLPLYRTREEAEAALQKMVRKSLYAKVLGGIEAIVDVAFRRGCGGEPEKTLYNALLDYKEGVDK